jgi:O-antigen ligase
LFGTPDLFEIKGLIPLINSNTVGFMAGLIVLINLHKRNKTIVGIASILLFFSGSMTSLILTIVMAAFLLLSTQKFIFLSLSSLLLAFFGWELFVSAEDIEKAILFSGRALLWDRVFDIYVNEFNFVEGVGLGAARELNSQFYGGLAVSFHNAYLEVLVSLGWLGLLVFILIIFYVVYSVRKNIKNYKGIEVTLLLYVLLRAFSSSNLAFVSIDSLIFWSVYFYSYRNLYFRGDLIKKDKYEQQRDSNYETPKV